MTMCNSILCRVLFCISLSFISSLSLADEHILRQLPVGHWYEVPNSQLQPHMPEQFRDSTSAQSYLLGAQTGGAFDTKRSRLVVWGANRYYKGNELYVFDVDTLQWSRLTDPSDPICVAPSEGEDQTYYCKYEPTGYYQDGNPRSRNTNNRLEYIPSIDRVCSFGGLSMHASGIRTMHVDCFNFDTLEWEEIARDNPMTYLSQALTFDPVKNQTVEREEDDFIKKFDIASQTWHRYSSGPVYVEGGTVIELDPLRRKLFAFGGDRTDVRKWDIDNEGYVEILPVLGVDDITQKLYPGSDYDYVLNKIVVWNGGANVLSLDSETNEWKRHEAAPTNTVIPPAEDTKLGGRFRYIPKYNAYILVPSDVNSNVFLYKLTSESTAPDIPNYPAVNNIKAQTSTSGEIVLEWDQISEQSWPTLQGYNIYRRSHSEADEEKIKINSAAIDKTITTYTDATVVDGTGYYYEVVGIFLEDEQIVDGPSIKQVAVLATKYEGDIYGLNALWDGDVATVTWDDNGATKYSIYRGEKALEISYLTTVATNIFNDSTNNNPGLTYYKVAAIKEYISPFTGEIVEVNGPISDVTVLGKKPSDIASHPLFNLEPGHWYEAPNTFMNDVAPDPIPDSRSNIDQVINYSGSAVFDSKHNRLVVWGGGPSGYSGNEIYAFDVDTMKWDRLTEPSRDVCLEPDSSTPPDQTCRHEHTGYYADGTPRSRRMLDSIEYIPSVNKMCAFGGGSMFKTSSYTAYNFDCFNFDNMSWEKAITFPDSDSGYSSFISAYDPVSGYVYFRQGIYTDETGRYNPVTNEWDLVVSPNYKANYMWNAVVDPKHGKFLSFGSGSTSGTYALDIENPASSGVLNATGDTEIESKRGPGADYDQFNQRVVGYNGSEYLFALDLDQNKWEKVYPSASNTVTPPPPPYNGTYGRFRYIPKYNVFILVNHALKNVFFFKMPDLGSGTPHLPIVNLAAKVKQSKYVELSWSAVQSVPNLLGYNIYRQELDVSHNNTPEFDPIINGYPEPAFSAFEQINSQLISKGQTTFIDNATTNWRAYRYVVRAVYEQTDATQIESADSPFARAIITSNNISVQDVTLSWEKVNEIPAGKIQWSEVEGYSSPTYVVYKANSEGQFDELVAQEGGNFVYDFSTNHAGGDKYRVSLRLKSYNPFTNQVITYEGPLSAIVEQVEYNPGVVTEISNAKKNGDSDYQSFIKSVGSTVKVIGTYESDGSPVIITAVSGDQVITIESSDGTYTLNLPVLGTDQDWSITIADKNGVLESAELVVHVDADSTAPEVTVSGSSEIISTQSTVTLTGTVTDSGSGISKVYVVSDRYIGQEFGILLSESGEFSADIPLQGGINNISIKAVDAVGNMASKEISVSWDNPQLPVIKISSPIDGTSTIKSAINVIGTITSSSPKSELTAYMKDQACQLSETEIADKYSFTCSEITLQKGNNILEVTAKAPTGISISRVRVTYRDKALEEYPLPSVTVESPVPNTFITKRVLQIKGTAISELGVEQVNVNGQEADISDKGVYVSFGSWVVIPGTVESYNVVILVKDSAGRTAQYDFTLYIDEQPPVIQIATQNLEAYPEVNEVVKTPFTLEGTVTDKNLSGFTINGQSIGLIPGASAGTYEFSQDISLPRQTEQTISIEAWDSSNNKESKEISVVLTSSLDIEVISPQDGAVIAVDTQEYDLEMVVRIPGILETDSVELTVEGTEPLAAPITIENPAELISQTLTIPTTQDGERQLIVKVKNDQGELIANQTIPFATQNSANLPLEVVRQEPENGAKGIEVTEFIGFYFNRPIEPEKLQIEVKETVHGKVYKKAAPGVGLNQISVIEQEEVHKDMQLVAGGVSNFPGEKMVAFYPQQEFSYGAQLFITVKYDGAEISRSSLHIRPLPTLVQGFVSDQFNVEVEGIDVTIPKLKLVTTTDKEGSYSFGFGEAHKDSIPPGRYEAYINKGGKNPQFGEAKLFIDVQEGEYKKQGKVIVPILNKQIPYRRIESNMDQAILLGGDLEIDFSEATLLFPDGRDKGDVHAQFTQFEQFTYISSDFVAPHWVYSIQPIDIEVTGAVGISFKIPTLMGSSEYIKFAGPKVVITALDPETLMVMPVGTGTIDAENMVVTTDQKVEIENLNYLGYSLVDPAIQDILELYSNQEISLEQLKATLATQGQE